MITAGIDCGAKNTKTVILNDGQIIGKASVLTGFDQRQAVDKSLEKALQVSGIKRDEIEKIGGTGSGKDAIEMADVSVNDIYIKDPESSTSVLGHNFNLIESEIEFPHINVLNRNKTEVLVLIFYYGDLKF